MNREPLIFSDDYTGPRWTYGLRSRPPMLGAVPAGRIVMADAAHLDFPFGTIQYARELTETEIRAYELTPVPDGEPEPVALDATERAILVSMLPTGASERKIQTLARDAKRLGWL